MLEGVENRNQILNDLFRGNTVQCDGIFIVMLSESAKVPVHTVENIS